MDYVIQFAHTLVLYILLPLLGLVALLRNYLRKETRYRYPLTGVLAQNNLLSTNSYKKIIAVTRFLTLLGMVFLIAKPQLVDPKSKVSVEGIDIMLVLDVSGSMELPHHSNDERSRLEVAKREAMHFIDKRVNDAIGVVVFGKDAISRSPLTLDKQMLKQMVHDLQLGIVNPDGTVVATSIITAANRLKQSHAKSKVMILLTDGEPSEHDTNPKQAVEVAKKLGIKIYTIGIGDNQDVMLRHPLYGVVACKTTLNKPLLTMIAQETGGRFFEAKNAQDMRQIYDTIDKLEKTEIQAPIFKYIFDWFMPLLWLVCILCFVEIIMTTFMWFSV